MKDWIDVTDRIVLFAQFLAATGDLIQRFAALSNIDSFVSDWRQSNWEQLVEASLWEEQLAVYDGGADMYPDSSRIFRPDLMPTHIVVCTAIKPGSTILDAITGVDITPPIDGFPLEELCTVAGGASAAAPPFDHVRVDDEITYYAFRLSAVRFWVRPIRPDEI